MKPKYPKKNLSQLSKEANRTTNSSLITGAHAITTEENKILNAQHSFWYISSPPWDEYDVEFHFYERSQQKSTAFFSFFWTDLNTDNPFWGMKQWMVVIGNGNFYPWQNRPPYFHFIHNYNKILKSDWLSTVLISAQ